MEEGDGDVLSVDVNCRSLPVDLAAGGSSKEAEVGWVGGWVGVTEGRGGGQLRGSALTANRGSQCRLQ